ncbi:hypothetical protein [Arthrobacter sp. efr-133-TYG-104]|uniref:hypothetical protein n=1 Tax=Arthrobacter sp. efr-133-TYG-104 TaxID=3040324 RepID=UPI00254E34F3|nr:hypothetical protein [Arthrobacter sp. efr-133-TYG-104]
MPAQPASRVPDEAQQPPDEPLWCKHCDADQHLSVDSIQSHYPPLPNVVDVTYECSACRYSYEHTASIQRVALVLNRPGVTPGVLQFGGQFLHCGEPMKTQSHELRRIQCLLALEPRSSEQLYETCINTRILGCHCGFRMEIPD